jgi:hypothetical protein
LGSSLSQPGTTACTDITALEQVNPGQVSASTLYVPSNAQLLVNGAISDFECAYTRYVMGSATLMDEISNAIGSTAISTTTRRRLTTNATYGTGQCGANQQMPIYTTLSTGARLGRHRAGQVAASGPMGKCRWA